jgi:hypothetical protein
VRGNWNTRTKHMIFGRTLIDLFCMYKYKSPQQGIAYHDFMKRWNALVSPRHISVIVKLWALASDVFSSRSPIKVVIDIVKTVLVWITIDRFRSRTWTLKTTWKWRQNGVAYPYMGTTRHFHVVLDVRVLDLNLSNRALCLIACMLTPSRTAGKKL